MTDTSQNCNFVTNHLILTCYSEDVLSSPQNVHSRTIIIYQNRNKTFGMQGVQVFYNTYYWKVLKDSLCVTYSKLIVCLPEHKLAF